MPSASHDPTSPAAWHARITRCKTRKAQLVPDWAESVAYRRGKPFTDDSDTDRVAINLDWSKTKAKHANLFSQVPEVRLSPRTPAAAPAAPTPAVPGAPPAPPAPAPSAAVPVFAEELNRLLRKARVGTAVDEAVIDCINASGFGAVMVGWERRTEKKDVPTVDDATAQQLTAAGQPVPTEKVDATTDAQFTVRRFSPTDLLWPVEFTGSDFDDADWIGRSGVMTWAQAKHEFALSDNDKSQVSGGTTHAPDETLKDDTSDLADDVGLVEYDELFYWAYRFDPEERSYTRIKRLVFVGGIKEPKVDEDWAGQKVDPTTGKYLGACRFPIRVLTLTYLSDDCIPPSDSAIGRPHVLELMDSRAQMLLQRRRSIPIRGFDVNRVDPEVQTKLMDGTWQGMIPMNGPFSNAIWEIARANYPREDMEFDRVAKHDLDEVWQTSANQNSQFASGERSASEAQIVEKNFQTRVGYERARVGSFFLGIAEVAAGLLALYGEVQTEGWDRATIQQDVVFSILPDSTVLLDANQRLQRLSSVLNMIGKSGLINPLPIINEIAELVGLDPTKLQPQPQPPKPEMIKISVSDPIDVRDPIILAMLLKTGQAPTPDELEGAKQILAAATMGPQPPGPVETADEPPPDDRDWNVMPKIVKRADYQ